MIDPAVVTILAMLLPKFDILSVLTVPFDASTFPGSKVPPVAGAAKTGATDTVIDININNVINIVFAIFFFIWLHPFYFYLCFSLCVTKEF